MRGTSKSNPADGGGPIPPWPATHSTSSPRRLPNATPHSAPWSRTSMPGRPNPSVRPNDTAASRSRAARQLPPCGDAAVDDETGAGREATVVPSKTMPLAMSVNVPMRPIDRKRNFLEADSCIADQFQEGYRVLEKFHERVFVAKFQADFITKRIPRGLLDLGIKQPRREPTRDSLAVGDPRLELIEPHRRAGVGGGAPVTARRQRAARRDLRAVG